MLLRYSLFGVLSVLAAGMAFPAIRDLLFTAQRGEYYSHILLIPLVTGYLLFSNREKLSENPRYSPYWGSLVMIAGIGFYQIGQTWGSQFNQNDQASLVTFGSVVFWTGGFIALFGAEKFRRTSFPFLFLLFMVPLPLAVLGQIIYFLQVLSTEVTEILFFLSGVPYQREGFVFHLPGISIEVAEVCSGIRSSLALFITSILAGHFFLDRFWKKATLALVVFPVTVFKNAVRIITLSLLGAYVNEKILTGGFLHQSGGFLFFIPALGLLGLTLYFLRRQR